jgi:hypothetical protein
MKRFLGLLAASLYFASCQTDTVGIDGVDIIAEPVIAIPIGDINLNLDHLLVPDDSLIFDDNMDYKLVVAQDSVFSLSVDDLISLPAQSPATSSISLGTIGVNNVSMSTDISLGTVATDAGLTGINSAHGSNAPFPPIDQSDVGTYGGGGFGTFTSASFSNGSMTLMLTNDWPAEVSMSVDLVNTTTSNTILSFTLSNASANGGIASDTESLIGKSLPNNIGFKITSLSSPGTPPQTSVAIDTADALSLDISTADLEVYTALTALTTQDISTDTQYVDLSTGGSEELRELMFNTASFDYEFTSTLPEDLELGIGFPGSDKNGVEVDTTITIPAGQTVMGAISLDNTILDLTTDPSQSHSKLPISVSATLVGSGNQVSIDSSDALDMTFEMTNLQFGHIKGFFGTQTITIDNGSVPLSVDFLENFDGTITFSEPSISMDITNSIGLPIELALDFDSYANGTASSLNGPDFVLPYPTILGDTETGTLTFDNTNSQITDVFTLPKDSIVYGGAVNVNHDTATFGTENFVTSTSAIAGDLLMELPFTITAAGLAFRDTLAEDLKLADRIPDTMEVQNIQLFMSNTTTLPLETTIALKFYDENWNEVHMETVDLLISGVPNANGIVTAPSTSDITIDLNGAALEAVLGAKSVIAEATMDTYNGGSDPVKLRTDATIGISLGVQLEVSLTR